MCGSCHILRKTTKFQISSTAPLGVCVSTTPTQIGVASQLKSHKKERIIPILGNDVHLETTGFQLAFRTTVLAVAMLVLPFGSASGDFTDRKNQPSAPKRE